MRFSSYFLSNFFTFFRHFLTQFLHFSSPLLTILGARKNSYKMRENSYLFFLHSISLPLTACPHTYIESNVMDTIDHFYTRFILNMGTLSNFKWKKSTQLQSLVKSRPVVTTWSMRLYRIGHEKVYSIQY